MWITVFLSDEVLGSMLEVLSSIVSGAASLMMAV